MEFLSSGQISFKTIQDKHFDLIIVSSGYDKRCNPIINNCSVSSDNKIILNHTRKWCRFKQKENSTVFRSEKSSKLTLSLDNSLKLKSNLDDYFSSFQKDNLNIFVDFSSMSIHWLSAIIKSLADCNHEIKSASVCFNCSIGEYFPKKNMKFRISARSITHNIKIVPDSEKPSVLIIDLSLESEKAEYLIKKIKPAQLFLMYTDPAFNIHYAETLLKNNKSIINIVEMRNLINYPFNNLELVHDKLKNLCLDLRLNYRVIIAPLSPNCFSLISLLLNNIYPDIDVWNVKTENNKTVFDKKATSDPILYEVNFINDELLA